jgi:hypothetical protein
MKRVCVPVKSLCVRIPAVPSFVAAFELGSTVVRRDGDDSVFAGIDLIACQCTHLIRSYGLGAVAGLQACSGHKPHLRVDVPPHAGPMG